MWPQNVSANVNEICGSPVPGLVEKIDFWWRAGRFVSCGSDPMETSPCWGLQAGISSFGWAAAVATGCTIWKRSWRPPCVPVWDVMSWNNSTYSRESDPIPGSNPVSLLNLLAARLVFFPYHKKSSLEDFLSSKMNGNIFQVKKGLWRICWEAATGIERKQAETFPFFWSLS